MKYLLFTLCKRFIRYCTTIVSAIRFPSSCQYCSIRFYKSDVRTKRTMSLYLEKKIWSIRRPRSPPLIKKQQAPEPPEPPEPIPEPPESIPESSESSEPPESPELIIELLFLAQMEGLNQNEKIVWSCWETKTPREVVREAAAKGTHVNLAHKYLEAKNGWDKETTAEWFVAEVYTWVLQLLSRKQYHKASHVLTKINVSPYDHILNIAKESLDSDLRNYLTEQLTKPAGELKNDSLSEWKAYLDDWNLLNLLEKSFDFDGIPKQNNVFGSGKDIIVVTSTDVKTMTIKIIEKYPIEWKKTVASYLFLEIFDFSVIGFLDPEYLWRIMLEKNMVTLLRRWIALSNYKEKYIQYDTSMIDKNALRVDTHALESQETLKQVDDLFTHWQISAGMIEHVSSCKSFSFTKTCVYDALCAFGFVVDSEKDDLKLILRRLSRTQNLHNIEKIFSKNDITFKSHLNNMLAKFSVDFNFFKVMTLCVESELLKKDIENIEQITTQNCLDLWLLFKTVQESKDVSNFPLIIYETCKYLTEQDSPSYLSENHMIILGMMLFGDFKLFDIFNGEKSLSIKNITINWNESFENVLPHLYSVYERWKSNSLIIANDVTMYQLLSGYKGLDISKIFEFQFSTKNRRKSICHAPSHSREKKKSLHQNDEFPHFGNMSLMGKYAYDKKLNYLYYLKQNRPCMASQAFMIQQYQNFRRLNVRMLRQACIQAHTLALKNWNDNIVTSSCIAFITMIGCDATRCRTHIACTEIISSYMDLFDRLPKEEICRRIDDITTQLIENRSSSIMDVLKTLEKIYARYETEYASLPDFVDILYRWQTVMKFACFHKLPLPLAPLKFYISQNRWLPFLIFGDMYKVSLDDMLVLSREFTESALAQHLTQCIKMCMENQNRSRMSSETRIASLRHQNNSIAEDAEDQAENSDLNLNIMTDDLWEVMAVCHGPVDPPGALIKASAAFHCPVLAILSTCYEPDAVDVCWAQWLITSLEKSDSEKILLDDIRDASDINFSDEKIQKIIRICAEHGYYKTIYESFSIFYKESPLCILMKFIVRTVCYMNFDDHSVELLKLCKLCYIKYLASFRNSDGSWLPRFFRPKFIDAVAFDLIKIALCDGFSSSWQQKEFLKCISEAGLFRDSIVTTSDFCKFISLIDISMEVNVELNLGGMLGPNSEEAISEYVMSLVDKGFFDAAIRYSIIMGFPKDGVIITKWINEHKKFLEENQNVSQNGFAVLQFWAKCSFALKRDCVTPRKCVLFLKENCDTLTSNLQKFYFLRIILGWFEDVNDELWPDWNLHKDQIEYEMWTMYLSCEEIGKLHLLSIKGTCDYIMNFNLDSFGGDCGFNEISAPLTDRSFKFLLCEIIEDSNVQNISVTGDELNEQETEKWIRCIENLLNMGLIIDAWRLNKIFIGSNGHKYSNNPIELIEMCLQLVEGIIMPYELPLNLRNMITPFINRRHITDSQYLDGSFEDYVLISGQQEEIFESNSQSTNHIDTDIVSILDALAAKTGYNVIKMVANYFKISIQIGWEYDKVLKYRGNPLELITYLTGRSRMPLAKLVFRTFEMASQEIMEYLCMEVVSAIVSSHFTRTSGFRQKEHFHYTVWGYPLDSDFEMFLNLRSEDNSILGRMLLEHLSAFRRSYKTDSINIQCTDANDDMDTDIIEAVLDEEYQNIDDDEIAHLCNEIATEASPQTPPARTFDNQSLASSSTLTHSNSRKFPRDRRQQLDVISCTNVKISPLVRSNMKLLLKETKLTSKQINVISIELLVLAHECFSSVCDTEGIATTLRSVQTLSNQLLLARSWRLLVRLLTGMARYTEMAYIFQMLKDNDQFEFLLGQFDYMLGSQEEKINNFKHGLLDYLRRHCPGDTETYCLVALHFSMYSEAAEVKRKQANDLIVAVKQMALDAMKILSKRKTKVPEWIILASNDSTNLLLETALNHCTDGAELFAKGGCLGAAREMAGLAQLIALQISLLKTPPTYCFLNIGQESMAVAINKHLKFMEGLVYAHGSDALEGGWIMRWKELVYQRVVTGKDMAFTIDIGTFRPDIAIYIIDRYDEEKNKNKPDEIAIIKLRSFFK